MTASTREQACTRFDEDYSIGYAREMDVDGEVMLVMFDGDGDPVAMSRCGIVPLVSYAARYGIELLVRH